jgi:GcrA cell cycle regulator
MTNHTLANAWSDWQVERLRELWPQKDVTASEIGAEVGKGRNAVIGKAHRLKLPGRPENRGGAHVRIRPKLAAPSPKPKPRPPTINDADLKGVSLFDLEPGQCKWPLGSLMAGPPFLFCGEPASSPYCPAHEARALASRPTRPKFYAWRGKP